MLIKIMEVVKPKDDLKNVHKGIVVKNDDPKKLGRVKVTIKGLFDDTSNNYDKLPWVTCFNPSEFGNNKGAINPPLIGSKLKIMWLDDNDIYFPYYSGYWLDKTNSPCIADGFNTQFQDNYPNVYGHEDNKGNYEIVNNSVGFTERGFEGGYKVKINKDGKLTEVGLKEYIIEVLNKYQVDANNILLGTGSTGHKALVTEDHFSKYNDFVGKVDAMFKGLSFIDSLFAGAYSTLLASGWTYTLIPPVPPTPLQEINPTQNKTSQVKGK